jgi:hypothetical protein
MNNNDIDFTEYLEKFTRIINQMKSLKDYYTDNNLLKSSEYTKNLNKNLKNIDNLRNEIKKYIENQYTIIKNEKNDKKVNKTENLKEISTKNKKNVKNNDNDTISGGENNNKLQIPPDFIYVGGENDKYTPDIDVKKNKKKSNNELQDLIDYFNSVEFDEGVYIKKITPYIDELIKFNNDNKVNKTIKNSILNKSEIIKELNEKIILKSESKSTLRLLKDSNSFCNLAIKKIKGQ